MLLNVFIWMSLLLPTKSGLAIQGPLSKSVNLTEDSITFQLPALPEAFETLAIPDSWSQKYAQELLKLSFSMKSGLPSASLLSWEEALEQADQGLVFLGNTFPKDSLIGDQVFIPLGTQERWIFIRAKEDSIQRVHFFYQSGETFSAGDFVKEMGWKIVGETFSKEAFEYKWKKNYSFDELGFPESPLKKDNSLLNKTFPTYLTKGFYKNWKVNFDFTVSNPEGSDAYLNFLVNNNLIRTFQVKQEGKYQSKFSIPPMPLSVGSFFTVELVSGTNQKVPDWVTVDIDLDNSMISPTFRNEFPMTFSSFPKNMEGKPLKILIDYDLAPSEWQALAEMILLINRRPNPDYPFYFPEIIRIDNPETLSSFDANLLLITQTPLHYTSLINNQSKLIYSEEGREFQSDELEKFFQYHSQEGLSTMELLDLGRHKMLFIVNDPKERQSMSEAVDGLEDEIISNTGNILLADAQHYYFFDIRLKESSQIMDDKKAQFELFWSGYRLYITIFLFAGLLFLLRYIYTKSQHAKKSIEDARN